MRVDGKLFGLPFKGQVLTAGFFYNISLFEQARRRAPQRQLDAGRPGAGGPAADDPLREGRPRSGATLCSSWGGENFTGHLRQWNGDSLSKDGKKATMDSPEVVEGLQWYEAMFHRERVLHPIAEASNDFLAGKVAMIGRTYFNYKSTILPGVGDPRTGKFKWDGAMMPKHAKTGKRGGIFAGDSHAMTRDSKSPRRGIRAPQVGDRQGVRRAAGSPDSGLDHPGGRPDVYADERILNAPGVHEARCRRRSWTR